MVSSGVNYTRRHLVVTECFRTNQHGLFVFGSTDRFGLLPINQLPFLVDRPSMVSSSINYTRRHLVVTDSDAVDSLIDMVALFVVFTAIAVLPLWRCCCGAAIAVLLLRRCRCGAAVAALLLRCCR